MDRTVPLLTTVAALLLTAPAAASAVTPYVGVQAEKIRPDGLDRDDRFPAAVDADEDRVVFGSPRTGDHGAVLVYEQTASGLQHEATLTVDPMAPTGEAELGADVAVDGDRIVAGAGGADPGDVFEAGAGYIWTHGPNGWTLDHEIPAPDPDALDRFGGGVAVDGTTLAIAEPEDDQQTKYSRDGRIHVYEDQAGSLVKTAEITPPHDGDGARLGLSMELEAGTLVAGAPDEGTATGTGAAYVYGDDGTGWSQEAVLTAPDAAEARQLGRDVALEDGAVVAGAPGPQVGICCPSPPVPEGQAHAWEQADGSWSYVGELDPKTSTEGAAVGMSVAVDGDQAYVGSPSAPFDSVYGWVTSFERGEDGWTQEGKLVPSDPASGDRFGDLSAAANGRLVVGAPGDDGMGQLGGPGDSGSGENAGAGYLFVEPGDAASGLPT
jgi:hypothetical protein